MAIRPAVACSLTGAALRSAAAELGRREVSDRLRNPRLEIVDRGPCGRDVDARHLVVQRVDARFPPRELLRGVTFLAPATNSGKTPFTSATSTVPRTSSTSGGQAGGLVSMVNATWGLAMIAAALAELGTVPITSVRPFQ
jgi:hypothetical protein